jgi:hypothetical protein
VLAALLEYDSAAIAEGCDGAHKTLLNKIALHFTDVVPLISSVHQCRLLARALTGTRKALCQISDASSSA